MKNQAKKEEKEGIGRPMKLTGVAAHGREASDRSSGGGPTAVGGWQRAWEGEEGRSSGEGERRGKKWEILGFFLFNPTIYSLLSNYQNTLHGIFNLNPSPFQIYSQTI